MIQRMLGVERLGRAIVGGVGHQLVPPVVAARPTCDCGVPVRRYTTHVLDRRAATSAASSTAGFSLIFGAAAVGAVLRDHQRRLRSR